MGTQSRSTRVRRKAKDPKTATANRGQRRTGGPGGAGRHPMRAPDPMRAGRCSARSKQTREPCKQPAILGGSVCRYHGGAAPQVQKSARERIAAAAHPAIDVLLAALKSRDLDLAMKAARDLLDRAGFASKRRHELALSTDPFAAVEAAVREANQ